ncbi:unnamed protein product, partial [marine sediment metagenome]
MPTYPYRHTKSNHDMKCKKCGKEFKVFAWGEDVNKIKCDCGGDTIEILIKPSKSKVYDAGGAHIWKPYWEENITHQPVLVKSKKHLK